MDDGTAPDYIMEQILDEPPITLEIGNLEFMAKLSTVISVIMQRPNFYRKYATPIFDSSFLLILS